MEIEEYTILEHLLCYFVNGDLECYNREELKAIQLFEQELLKKASYLTVEKIDNSDNFLKCDILKVYGNTITAKFYIR